MSRAGLARIWATLGALLSAYAVGTWIILQGGKSFAEIPGLEAKAPVTSAYLAIPIIGVLLSTLSAVGLSYMRTSKEPSDSLLPVVAIADLGPHLTSSRSIRVYQTFFILVFLLIPAAALYQLNTVVLERGVLWHEDDPALGGIALKNAFALTQGADPFDSQEHACAQHVMRPEGYVWLGNARCDFVKNGRLQPFNKEGESVDQNITAAKPTCARELASAHNQKHACEGIRDISEHCEASERNCRGVQWLPLLSPLLLIVPTLLGWLMLTWLLVEALYRNRYPAS